MKHFALMVLAAFSVSACANTYNAAHTDSMASSSSKMNRMDNTVNISVYSFTETDRRLKAAIDKRDLKTFAVVNHGDGARSVGMDIGKSKLYIFGNPKSGTPLMVSSRQMGLELPMKILVHTETDGTVHVGHPDIKAVAAQYGVTGKDELLGKISMTLHEIIREATT